jgi:hypothetical protein
MRRKLDELDPGWRVVGRVRVEREPTVGGELVSVRARLVARAHAFRRRRAIESHAVEISLGRVLRRGKVVEIALRLGGPAARDDVARAGGEKSGRGSIAGVDVGLTPAALLAQQDEGAVVADPLDPGVRGITRIDPGRVGLGVERGKATALEVRDQEGARIAAAREALDQHLFRSHEADAVQVVALGRGRYGEPAGLAAVRPDHTDAERRYHTADSRKATVMNLRIGGVARVEHRPQGDRSRIRLHIDDAPSIRAPGRAGARAVHHGVNRSIGRQGDRALALKVARVEIVLAHVQEARSIRGHALAQGNALGARGERLEHSRATVEVPVVREPAAATPWIGPRVGEQQQPRTVRRGCAILDNERLCAAGHHESLEREKHTAAPVAGVVDDQLALAAAGRALLEGYESGPVGQPDQGTHRAGRELSPLIDGAQAGLHLRQGFEALSEAGGRDSRNGDCEQQER